MHKARNSETNAAWLEAFKGSLKCKRLRNEYVLNTKTNAQAINFQRQILSSFQQKDSSECFRFLFLSLNFFVLERCPPSPHQRGRRALCELFFGFDRPFFCLRPSGTTKMAPKSTELVTIRFCIPKKTTKTCLSNSTDV